MINIERVVIIINSINSVAKDLNNLPKLKVFLQDIIPCPTHEPFIRITLNIVNYYSKARYIKGITLMRNKEHITDTRYDYLIAIKKQRMNQQEIKDQHYKNEINSAKKKYLSPIRWKNSNKIVNFDKFSFTPALKENIKGIQQSLFLRFEDKINHKYHKGIYSISKSLFGNSKELQQRINDQCKAKKYQSHNFLDPKLLKPNNELTVSYWINKNSIPNKVVIKAKDPISLIREKHTYKIQY